MYIFFVLFHRFFIRDCVVTSFSLSLLDNVVTQLKTVLPMNKLNKALT